MSKGKGKIEKIKDLTNKMRRLAEMLADPYEYPNESNADYAEILNVSYPTICRWVKNVAVQELAWKRFWHVTKGKTQKIGKAMVDRALTDSGSADRRLYFDRLDKMDLKDKGIEVIDVDSMILLIQKSKKSDEPK